jgi:alkanesulfonate monooxygenase SsuD/methylene tetrahydromethanopterin reductase-like flavin-dependent oxidoreductase (luciferase family)
MCKLAGRTRRVTGVMISSITDPEYLKYLKQNIEAGARSVSRNQDEIEVGVVPSTIISNNRDEAFKLAKEGKRCLPSLPPSNDGVCRSPFPRN